MSEQMIITVLIMGILSAIGFILILVKFGSTWVRRMLGYDVYFDIIITLGFMYFMGNTYSGALVAILSGIFISIVLFITKLFTGYERLKLIEGQLQWVSNK